MKYEIGSDLQRKRIEIGVPASVIARKLQISRQALSNKENDKREFSASELIGYCKALGLNIEDVTRKYFF